MKHKEINKNPRERKVTSTVKPPEKSPLEITLIAITVIKKTQL